MSMRDLMKPLRRGLRTLRRRTRSLMLVLGISRVVALLVTVLVTYFLADYFMRLPLDVRRILALLIAGSLGYAFFARVLKPISRELSDQMLAARVEAEHPELENRLSSSLAFAVADQDPENEDSPELMRAVIEETAGLAGTIRFEDVAKSRTTSRWAAAAITLLLLMSVGAVAKADRVATFVQRAILLRDIAWPRRTTLSVLDMRPGEPRAVTRGRETTIEVRAQGSIPDRVRFTWWERGRESRTVETMDLSPTAGDSALFQITMSVYASYEFKVSGGDDDRELIYSVRSLTPPSILRIEMECEYPPYLERAQETLRNGDQRLPQGTKVLLRIKANMPLSRATIKLNKAAPVPMTAEAPDRYTIALEAKEDLRYSLRLRGKKGEENDPVADTFVLRVLKDHAPVVRVHTPVTRSDRVAKGVVLVGFTVRDDYRVTSARLKYVINDGKWRTVALGESGGAGLRMLASTQRTQQSLLALAALDLGQLRTDGDKPIAKGDSLTYYVEASDSAGQTQRTRADYRVTILPEEDISQKAQNRQNSLRESAERTDDHAVAAVAAVEEVRVHSGADPSEFRRWSGRAQAAQGRVIGDLDSLARSVRAVLNLYVFNRLDNPTAADQILPYYERHLLDPFARSGAAFFGSLYRSLWAAQQERAIRATGALVKLVEMSDLSDRLAMDHGPAAYKALGRLGARLSAEDSARALDEVVSEQKIISDGLARLGRLMMEWQSYEGVVRFFKSLRDKEKGFIQELKGIKPEESGDD